MARTKISKVAADLNISIQTVKEFLQKQNIEIDNSPNARIDEDVVELLVNHFKSGRDIKRRSDQFSSERQQARKEAKAEQSESTEVKAPIETIQRVKVLGKIALDEKGQPIVKPVESEQPMAEKSTENEEQLTQSTAIEEKTEVEEPIVVNPEAVNTDEKDVETSLQDEKNEAVIEDVNNTKFSANSEDIEVETNSDSTSPTALGMTMPEEALSLETTSNDSNKKAETAEEEVFTIPSSTSGPQLNIIGKIDLDAINQATRPKKKSKEERKNDRPKAQPGTGSQSVGGKKKRTRIGKEKVDVEKAVQQVTDGGNESSKRDSSRREQQGGGHRKDKAAKADPKSKRPIHTEVNDEDVQRQVKEVLARLTSKDKGLKKGAKWRKEKREAFASREREAEEMAVAESRVLKLTEFVTANDLASMMDKPVNEIIATCMNLGVMVSINQRLDAETINIVAEEFGFKTEYVSADVTEAINDEADDESELVSRPPIVTVMGHVDHGKTSLLDYIRNANVIAGEAGGITQHIGAYNVKLADGRHITFLDTPGHEAFTAMRARGAKVTDICIIIVAADDNVMPQTVEAINHASAAGVPMVFAINKIDKPHANPDKIKEELAGMNYLVEEWGGKYQSQDISAKKGTGVDELMEKVLLEAEMLDLKANPNRNATGSIIESSLDKGRGYVATVLVQNGTLRVGDIILAGTHFGKIKAMFNERNQRIKQAGPAEPAIILGLNGAPAAGDTFNVLDSEQEAREIATKREQLQRELGLRTKKLLTLEDIGRRRAIGNFQELNIVVKGDVDGSIEALSDSLIKLSTEEIQVNVLHKAVGEISESDVTLATASDAIIIGFQVRPSLAARREAEREGVQIRLYSVIYQAIEEVKDAMAGMLAPEVKEEVIGMAEVLETYHISKVGTIAGAMVREGKLKRSCKVRLIRDGIVRYTGELGSLKRFKDDAKEVTSGYDCGLSILGFNDLKVGDFVEAFEEVEVNRTL